MGPLAEIRFRGHGVDDHLGTYNPDERLAVFDRGGNVKPQAAAARRRFGDPTAPHDHVPVPHQELVGAGVELAERQFISAVIHVVQDRPVAATSIDGRQHLEVRRKLDEPSVVTRRQFEIDHGLIRRVRRIDRKVEPAAQRLISADSRKRPSVGVWLAT